MEAQSREKRKTRDFYCQNFGTNRFQTQSPQRQVKLIECENLEELSEGQVNEGLCGSPGVPNIVNHPPSLGPIHLSLVVRNNEDILGYRRR